MYWTHVARKDFADAVRSKMFWALSILMILFAFIGLYAPQAFQDDPDAEFAVALLSSPMLILVPIISLVVGYMAIVGERQTGSIRMMLSLPLKRKEVLVGKFVGRTGVVTIPILLAFVLAIPFVYFLYGSFPAEDYARFVTRALLLAVVFVALAVGVSGSFDSRGKALGSIIGLFVLFEWLWGLLPLGIYYVLNSDVPTESQPDWYEFILEIAPSEAARAVVDAVFSLSISTDEPLLFQEWVAGIVLLLWIFIPLGIGYFRFKRANIG